MPRIYWDDLPGTVRSVIQEHTGPVREVKTVAGGVNSGIAVIIRTSTQKIFVKGVRSDHPQVRTQQREAEINPYILQVGPRMFWQVEVGGWNVLGFEHVQGRHADYSLGSPDLPKVAEIVRLLGHIPCPVLPLKRVEQRWAGFADKSMLELLEGDYLLHTDLAPHNILVNGRAHLIDWAWPTRGPAWVDVALLVVHLIDAGHTPAQAADWVQQFPSWQHASVEAIDAFTAANCRMWQEIAQNDPVPWKKQMAAAAQLWMKYRL